MGRPRRFVILLGAAGAAVAVVRHGRRVRGREVPGGIIVGDAVVYDTMRRLVSGSLIGRIADDVAAVAPDRARFSRSVAGLATCRSAWQATTASR